MEIYTDTEGGVIFKKYSPMGEMAEFTSQYAEVLNKATNMPVLVTDRDHVIAASGVNRRDLLDKRISTQLETVMENRMPFIGYENSDSRLQPIENIDQNACLVFPIIGNGDVSGSVVLLYNTLGDEVTQAEIKLVQVAAQFLARQTEE